MKKVFFIFGALLLLLVAGLFVFLRTFNVDRYRPLLTRQLEEALGRPVQLEHIALGFKGGVAVQLKGFELPATAEEGEPLVHVDSIAALVRLRPLLRKEVQLRSLVFSHPTVHIGRDRQGQINVMGLGVVASPAVSMGKPQPVRGTPLSLDIDLLRIEQGELHWTDASTTPPMDLWLKQVEATIRHISTHQPMTCDIKAALGSSHPNLSGRGHLMLPGEGQAGSFKDLVIAVDQLPLEAVMPPASPAAPQLHGRLTMTLEGQAPTLDPQQLLRSMTGSAQLALDDPMLMNLNLLRAVFDQFSMLPGLVERLIARLPPARRAALTSPHTKLMPVRVAVQMQGGVLRCEHLRLAAEGFQLSGNGQVDVDGAIQVNATLHVDPDLSTMLISSVNELQYLATREGAIEIPISLQGRTTHLVVLPDLNYVASKLIAAKIHDVLGDVLKNALQKYAPQSSSPQQ